jgi:hypothetical protein
MPRFVHSHRVSVGTWRRPDSHSLAGFFRRLRIVAKSAYSHRRARLSACISADLTWRIPLKFVVGDLYENLSRKYKIWLKSDKNISHTWRPKYILLLPAKLNCHNSAVFEWNGVSCLCSRGDTEITRMQMHVTLCVRCLSCWLRVPLGLVRTTHCCAVVHYVDT